MSNTETIEMSLRMSAALDYVASGKEEEIRTHYLWLVKEMMANLGGPEQLTTSQLVATVVAWTPAHSRVVSGGKPAGEVAAVLRLVPPAVGSAPTG